MPHRGFYADLHGDAHDGKGIDAAIPQRDVNDVKYIMELPSENGRRFRLVTDRILAFGELYRGTRSRDYSVGAIELVLTPDGKGSGTVLPACKLSVDKKKQQIEVETFQNPWKLTNLMVSND